MGRCGREPLKKYSNMVGNTRHEGFGGWGAVRVGRAWGGRAWTRLAFLTRYGGAQLGMHLEPLKQFSDTGEGCGGWGAVWAGAAGVGRCGRGQGVDAGSCIRIVVCSSSSEKFMQFIRSCASSHAYSP